MTHSCLPSDQQLSKGSPSRSGLGGPLLGVILVLYLITYLGSLSIGQNSAAGIVNTVFQVTFDAATGFAAFRARHRAAKLQHRTQLFQLCIASFLMACVNLTWGLTENLPLFSPSGLGFVVLNRLPYLIVLSVWLLFWFDIFRTASPANSARRIGTIAAATCSALVVAAVFILYYFIAHSDSHKLGAVNSLFSICYIGLELSGLVTCIVAATRNREFPILLGLSYSLLVSSDLVFNTAELLGKSSSNDLAEIVWSGSQVLLFVGLSTFTSPALSAKRTTIFTIFPAVLVIAPVLTIGFVTGICALPLSAITRNSFLLATISITAIATNFIVRSFLDAIETATLTFLTHADSESGPLLKLTRFEDLLTFIRTQIVRPYYLPVGISSVFDLAAAWQPTLPRRAVICMPFTKDWSAQVFVELSTLLAELNWDSVRADFSFAKPDALEEVWQLICQAELVIADITDTTPNVMYELGLCHVIAKPTIILRQRSTTVPFDISTRRVHSYDIQNGIISGLDRPILRTLIMALDQFKLNQKGPG